MKVRDTLNTIEGYKEIIDLRIESIEEDLLEYNENKDKWDLERIKTQFEDLSSDNFSLIYALYSQGNDINIIAKKIENMINFAQKSWKSESGYVQMVEMLSIGIMLNIEQDEFDKLIQCVKNDNPNDFLIDFLIHYRDNTWKQKASKFMWNKPYKLTQEIVELAKTDKEKALISLKKYLKQWYKSIEIKTHNSKWNIHEGYWCWEAGALIKILRLDDSSLKDQQYYPYDMAHFKD